jgi:ABC-2 type transport system ATP-binding protein
MNPSPQPPPLPETLPLPKAPRPASQEVMISVRAVQRVFENVHAVRGLTFDIFRGQVVGFIGANGAGKTTTMRMMATLDMPTAGTIAIAGYDVVDSPAEVRQRIGWMPDSYGVYSHMTVFEYLDFFARACGLRAERRLERVQEVMAFADLTSISDRMINALSKGMGQRLCFGRTLLRDPEVLILDEPAAGLDPKARVEFKNLVRLLAREGKTIFISSHILSELGEICDTLLFIDQGQIVHHGTPESLERHPTAEAIYDVQVHGDPEVLTRWISLNPHVRALETRKSGVRLAFDHAAPEAVAAQLRKMILDGVPVLDFHRESRRLEDAFVDMLRKDQP